MRRLGEKESEMLREQTVHVLLEVRSAYLRSGSANVLKHWDQIQNRMRSAARRSESVEEWGTKLMEGLNLGAPSSSLSSTLLGLAVAVQAHEATTEWLDLIEREHGLLMALARSKADAVREDRERASSGTEEVRR